MSAAEIETTAAPRATPSAPSSRCAEIDGEPVVYIPLVGKRGEGREAVVSAWRWPAIEARYGSRWGVVRSARGVHLVVGYSARAQDAAGVPLPRLSHIVAGAGQKVAHTNGDTLDCRDGNLSVRSVATKAAGQDHASPIENELRATKAALRQTQRALADTQKALERAEKTLSPIMRLQLAQLPQFRIGE